MQKVTAKDRTLPPDPESAVESTESTGDDTRGIGGRLVKLNPSLAALVTWLACLPVAFAAATLGQADPFRLRVAMIPVAVLVAGVIAVGLASRRLPADLASGIAAGLFGGWVAFTLRVAVHGTPFGFGGLGSDAGRLAAMANRYAHAWRSSDAIVPSVPSHYPPLFPWLVGRLSALLHVPAWRLLSPAEAITLSFVVIAGYLLWRRLLPGPLALAVTLPVLLCFALPSKVYEVLALAVFIPWAVATFGDPPRGRLHWLPAGLIGGLSIVLNWAFIIYGALGLLALAVLTWRASPDRARYVRQVALTILVAVVVASWYLIPYLGWGLLHGSSQVDDLFQGGGIQNSPLLFLSPTPLGVLELIGVAGLVWWRGRVWWGRPLLLLAGSAYAYWLLGLISFIVAKHHLLLQDTPRMIGLVLAAAGVLTIAQAAPGVVRRLSVGTVPAGLPALALCLLIIWTGFSAWQAWMPGGPTSPTGLLQPPVNSQRNDTTAAFTTPLPGGSYPRAAPASMRNPPFPTGIMQKDVASVLGANAAPVTLSASEQLFAFVNWPGYIGVTFGAAGIDTNWPARYADLEKLSRVTGPAAFAAAASARTEFGPIDVFILERTSPVLWTWRPAGSPEPAVTFTPAQFNSDAFTVFDDLPGNFVLVVRQPPGNG